MNVLDTEDRLAVSPLSQSEIQQAVRDAEKSYKAAMGMIYGRLQTAPTGYPCQNLADLTTTT